MKNFKLKDTEDNWKEIRPIQLTKAERDLLSDGENKSQEKRTLQASLKGKREKLPIKKDKDKATEIYNKYKPKLEETDIYEIIQMDLTIDDEGKERGIINCRINGEHKQIRF